MKRIIFKGKIKAVTAELNEIAKEYDGWTVEQFLWLANLNKRFLDGQKQKNF